MKKKIMSVFLVGLIMSVSIEAYAAEPEMNEADWTYVSSVTDEDELEKIIEKENIEVPEGYHLESVDTYIYNNASEDLIQEDWISQQVDAQYSPRGIVYNIKNVKNKGDGFYFSSEYDSDWFYGPATVSEQYTRTNSVKMSVDAGVANSVISGAVGYSVTSTYSCTKTFTTTVASGKKVNVKIHTNYAKTTFDVYNKLTGNCVQSGAYTMKPVGLIFKQYTYSQ